MSQRSFSPSLVQGENWCSNQSRRGFESYQSLPVALQGENPYFWRNENSVRGAHQVPPQISVVQNQNSGWFRAVQNQSGFLVADSSAQLSVENRQSRLARKVTDQNQMVQQGGIYLDYPSRGQPGQIQGGIRNQTVVYSNNPLVRQNRAPFRGAHVQQNMSFGVQEQVEFVGNRAPPRGAQFQQNINFGVQEQGEFGECRVLPRGAQVQQSMNFGIEGQCGIWENGAPSAQERVYYGNTTESFVPVQFNPNNQPQVQHQAFALPQPVQDGFVPHSWPYQHPVQGAQMELEMELQKVKLSGQYAKVLKELPILNGTEGREAIIDFFTALETRTTEWSSERIVEVMQIKLKGKAQKATTAAVNRFGNSISLKDLRTEISKILYDEESFEKIIPQDRVTEPIKECRSSSGEVDGWGVEFEVQNQQILEKNHSQNNFLDNVSFGEFGETTFAPKKLPLEISFTSEETVQFVNLKRLRASSVSPIQSFFWETPVHGTRMLQPSCCLESSSGNLPGDQQPQRNRKVSAKSKKEEVPPKRADEERIKTLEKQLELVSKERDKLKTLVESFIGGNETNRKSRKVLAHKLRKVFPVEKTEKTVTTGKSDLAKKIAHSSGPKIVQNPSEILVTPPTRGPIPFPNSVKSHQKEPAGKVVRSNVFETGRRTGFGRVFVNSALKRPQATQNLCQRSPKRKNSGVSSQNIRKRENFGQHPVNLHRGVRVFVNSRYKKQSERSDLSTPITPQNRWCLNMTTQLSASNLQFEVQSQSVPPPPQSNFQVLQPTCLTGQHQQVDEDATLDGDGGGRTNRR